MIVSGKRGVRRLSGLQGAPAPSCHRVPPCAIEIVTVPIVRFAQRGPGMRQATPREIVAGDTVNRESTPT